MKCKACKREIPENSIFCNWCGAKQLKQKDEVSVPKPRKLASGAYSAQIMVDGQRVTVTAPTEKEYYSKARATKTGLLEIQKMPAKDKMTLREACERHIQRKEVAKRSPETIRSYAIIVNNRFQSAMEKKVSAIQNWQSLYDADAKHLSPKTMKETWAFIKAACKSECGVTLPEIDEAEVKRAERPFLEPEEIKIFVAAIRGHKYEIPMLLELSSCRSSEVSGIDWSDVDLCNNRIKVQGAVVRDKHNRFVEKHDNKTDASTRYVPIFIPELRDALAAVEDKAGKLTSARPNTIYRNVNAICRSHGLPEVGNHGLRHSFASLAYSLEIPIKITMQIGGWSDYNTVLRVYTHLAQRDVGKHTAKIEDFFSENSRPSEKPKNATNELLTD